MALEAKYEGRCGGCLERIHVGDTVEFGEKDSFTGHRRVVHVDCDAAAPVERAEVVCPECWLIKPCGCEDGL